jgi:plastocyanin
VRRSLILLAVIALAGVAACSSSASSAPSAAPASAAASAAPASAGAAGGSEDVTIQNFAFNPATISVKVGDKITWTNKDNTAHTVTFDDTSLTGSGNVNNGATFSNTFTTAGSFTYHCKIHPTMKGTVTVS